MYLIFWQLCFWTTLELSLSKNDKVTVWLETEIVMIIFNFPTKSMQFCAIKAFIKFKWIIVERKKTIIILAAAAVSTTIEKRFLFDFHIICRSAGIFFSKKNDDSLQRYNGGSDGDTTFDKWWIVDDFLRWSPHYTRVISTSFVQLYGSWRDSILIHILEKKLYSYMNNNRSTFVLILKSHYV